MRIKRHRRPLVRDGLVGPDLPKRPPPVEVVGNRIDVWAMQFVNRWVFLPQQRADALDELKELIQEARRET